MFRKIKIERWRQFELVDIEFHPSLTVLTGANGSGKTTILNILSKHYGWNTLFISTPKRESTGLLKFFTDIWNSLLNDQVDKNINQIIKRNLSRTILGGIWGGVRGLKYYQTRSKRT
ncbi:MAG: AAA family ATPase [Nostoc sp.]